jgi:Flp pilus assembly protein TadD
MLLRLNLSTAHELARETYAQNPEDGIIASTYAYSLHLQGRTKEGLDAFKKLKPETLDQPLVAFYYGLLLSASGQTNQAGKYLSLASKSELLPEERNLMAQASKAL